MIVPRLLVQLPDVVPDVAARLGVEAEGGLVEEQDLGPVGQAPGDLQAPLHAARVLVDQHAGLVGELDQGQDLVDAAPALGLAEAVHHGVELEVLAAGQAAVEGRLLEDDADALAHGVAVAGDVEAGHDGGARGRPEEGREHVDRRRLAGPVRAEKPEQLALGDGERDAVDGGEAVERLDQAFHAYGVQFGVPSKEP